MLVDRMGDVYKHCGGVSLLVGHIAVILAERRAAARASTPGSVCTRGSWTVLPRSCQEAVFGRIVDKWAEGDGKQYVERIREEGLARTHAQERRALLGYFKTHCDHAYGGLLWFKFLIAIGDVPREAVEAANDVVRLRVQFKEHEWPTENPRHSSSHHFYSRAARVSTSGARGSTQGEPLASTPGQEDEEEPEEHPRKLRREAIALHKALEKDKRRHERWWRDWRLAQDFEQRRLDIDAKMARADRASYKHGFPFKDMHGVWQLTNPFTPTSFFEEALRSCLRELGFSQQEIASLTEKPAEPVLRRPAAASGSSGW